MEDFEDIEGDILDEPPIKHGMESIKRTPGMLLREEKKGYGLGRTTFKEDNENLDYGYGRHGKDSSNRKRRGAGF